MVGESFSAAERTADEESEVHVFEDIMKEASKAKIRKAKEEKMSTTKKAEKGKKKAPTDASDAHSP